MIKDIEHVTSEEENKMHRNAFWLRETSQDTKIMIKFTSNYNFELPINEIKSGNHTLSSNDDKFNVAEKRKTQTAKFEKYLERSRHVDDQR